MKSFVSRRKITWVGWLLLTVSLVVTGCRQANKILHRTPIFTSHIQILIWRNYVPADVIADFQDEFGIRVDVDDLDSNDELVDKLSKKHYDLAMPSSFKAKEIKSQLLPINANNVPNLANIDGDTYNSKFDLTNQYVVPYIWGSTGIGYRSDSLDGIPKSWANLFRSPKKTVPASSEVTLRLLPELSRVNEPGEGAKRYETTEDATRGDIHTAHNKSRRLGLLDDARFTLGCALLYLKHPLDTAGEPEIREAGELIKAISSEIVFLDTDNIPSLLARKDLEMDMVMAWSADATRAMRGFYAPDESQKDAHVKEGTVFTKNTAVRMALPAEGTLIFHDCFVIPAGATNQRDAEIFLNYLLRPEIAGRVTNFSFYANTLKQEKVLPFVDRFIVNSASYFTNPAGSRFNFTFEDIPEKSAVIYQRVWEDVKLKLKPQTFPFPPKPKKKS